MDKELGILNRIDLPAALDALDDRIMGALAIRRREAVAIRRLMTLAAFVSLGGGLVAGSAVPQPAVAASPFAPLRPPAHLDHFTLTVVPLRLPPPTHFSSAPFLSTPPALVISASASSLLPTTSSYS